jgi:hypothetical protein
MRLVDTLELSPFQTLFGETRGPAVDTMVDLSLFDGRLFVSPLELLEIVNAGAAALSPEQKALVASYVGTVDPGTYAETLAEIDRLNEKVAALEGSLSVPLAEVIEFLNKPEPDPEPEPVVKRKRAA